MFLFFFLCFLSIAAGIAVNLIVHHFTRVRGKHHRVVIKNDLNDNGIRMAEQFTRSGVSVTILDHSGRDRRHIARAMKNSRTPIMIDDETTVNCYTANSTIDAKVQSAIDLLGTEFGPCFSIVDSTYVGLYDVWWMFSCNNTLHVICDDVHQKWQKMMSYVPFYQADVQERGSFQVNENDDARTPALFKFKVNDSLKDVFKVSSPAPAVGQTPRTSHVSHKVVLSSKVVGDQNVGVSQLDDTDDKVHVNHELNGGHTDDADCKADASKRSDVADHADFTHENGVKHEDDADEKKEVSNENDAKHQNDAGPIADISKKVDMNHAIDANDTYETGYNGSVSHENNGDQKDTTDIDEKNDVSHENAAHHQNVAKHEVDTNKKVTVSYDFDVKPTDATSHKADFFVFDGRKESFEFSPRPGTSSSSKTFNFNPSNGIFVFGSGDGVPSAETSTTIKKQHKLKRTSTTRTSFESIANISINEELEKMNKKTNERSFNSTASTVESDALLLDYSGKENVDENGVFVGPMRSNTLSENKFSSMDCPNLASPAILLDKNQNTKAPDEVRGVSGIPVRKNETKKMNISIDEDCPIHGWASSLPNRRKIRATRRVPRT